MTPDEGVDEGVDEGADPLLVTSSAGVLRLQLNRPEARNAINWAIRRKLHRTLDEASRDHSVRVVVIAGDDRAFCSGGDIKEMGRGDQDTSDKLIIMKAISAIISDMAKPVVAEVRGHAAGAGFGLALTCDLVLADDTAVFTSTFIQIGLVPDLGTTYWLARQVGLHRAKEMILTGRSVLAREAFDLGIVSRLWAPSEFRAGADSLIATLAAQPAVGMGLTKPLLNRTFQTDLSTAMDAEKLSQLTAANSADHQAYLAGVREGVSVRHSQSSS